VVCPICGQRLNSGKHEPERYIKTHGRPLGYYTDKASLFQTAVKTKRDGSRKGKDREELPPTQIGRALQELGIPWIAARSPQAKGKVERGFLTAQDRLVKGMRVARVTTLQQANHDLETEFLRLVNGTLAVAPANPDDAHRPAGEAARFSGDSQPRGKAPGEQ
jgi:hypothetical protein